jgi:transcriptional regulator of acetoin/glycerol metabolism
LTDKKIEGPITTAPYLHPKEETIAEPEEVTPTIVGDSSTLEEDNKDKIIATLKKHNGKRRAAAKELGISERTLYRKIIRYGL